MRFKTLLFSTMLVVWSTAALATTPTLTMATNVSGVAGQLVTVPITLTNGSGLHALEVHVKFDPTQISFPKSVARAAALTAGKMRVANLVAANDYKIGLLADITKADTAINLTSYDKAMTDGEILNVIMLVNPTATGSVSLTLEAAGADATGNAVTVTGATGTITLNNPTSPVLNFSTLPDGTTANTPVVNVCGQVSSSAGIRSVTVKGQTTTVNADGTFCRALALASGSNAIPIVATDNSGNPTTVTRTITYSATSPALTVTAPADNTVSNQATITVSGTADTTITGVQVNGGFADIASGAFTATANLLPGLNTVDIVATTLTGTTTVKRTVYYDANKPGIALTLPLQDVSSTGNKLNFQGTVSSDVTSVSITISVDGQILQTLNPTVTNNSFATSTPVDITKITGSSSTKATSKPYEIVVTATGANGTTSIQRSVLFRPGDCSGDAQVKIGEIIKAVNMSVGATPVLSCADTDGNGKISIGEIIKMVNISVGF